MKTENTTDEDTIARYRELLDILGDGVIGKKSTPNSNLSCFVYEPRQKDQWFWEQMGFGRTPLPSNWYLCNIADIKDYFRQISNINKSKNTTRNFNEIEAYLERNHYDFSKFNVTGEDN